MPKLKQHLIHVAVFFCGAVVMIYEIVGSRVISPYIGTSTYTWTSLIGVILGALSLGYWLGGKWADRSPHIGVLASVIFFAGGMVGVMILAKDIVLEMITSVSLPVEFAAVLAAVLLFAPASILLGFVTPYAVRLSIEAIDHTGRTVGRLYALSTIGSITGTFLAGFVLIPYFGTSRTLYLLAAVLFGLSISLAPLAIEKAKIALLVVFVLGISVNEFYMIGLGYSSNYHDIDTEYNRVRIFDTTKNGRPLRAVAIDPYIYQSSMYLDNGEQGSNYLRFFHLASLFNPDMRYSLMIGGAGYGFPKEYLERYPEASIDVVEIDPGMTRLAEKHFRLKRNDRLESIHKDGRYFLNNAKPDTYDAVFVDAFTSLFSIPFQLTTVEAVREIEKVLNDEGIVLVNIGTALTGKGSLFLDAETATFKAVFDNVKLFQAAPQKKNGEIQNVILAASNRPLTATKMTPDLKALLDAEMSKKRPAADVLTDDFAPVERLISYAQVRFVENKR